MQEGATVGGGFPSGEAVEGRRRIDGPWLCSEQDRKHRDQGKVNRRAPVCWRSGAAGAAGATAAAGGPEAQQVFVSLTKSIFPKTESFCRSICNTCSV